MSGNPTVVVYTSRSEANDGHFAEQTGRFDHQLAHRLLNYLRANYTTSKIDDLGGPILRRDIASGANIEIVKRRADLQNDRQIGSGCRTRTALSWTSMIRGFVQPWSLGFAKASRR